MDTNTLPTPGSSKPEAINRDCTTVCGICEGFGKEDHPRSKSVPILGGDLFIYIYVHYPDLNSLQSSYERHRCRICHLILCCVSHESDSMESMNPHDEQALNDFTQLGICDIDKDTFEASRLVESAEVEFDMFRYPRTWVRIEGCGSRRVVLSVVASSHKGPQADMDKGDLDVTVHIFDSFPVARRLARCMQLWCSPVDPIDEDHAHRPARDLLSDAHTGLVRRWINTCEAEHETCAQHKEIESVQELPTRLLKIEGQNGEVSGVKLIDTKDGTGVYACLSYCWGLNRQLSMTTKTNLDTHHDSIPWQQLHPTISDAIKLCYKLGFAYLWIDSLCIVQDDHQDWLREASRMAGIYSRSALTLAIHLCEDTSHSFLQKRLLDPEQWSDGPYGCARIPFTDSSTGEKRDMYVWEDQSFKGSRFLDYWWRSIEEVGRDGSLGNWFRRAWTFQEWYLSPRVLHIHAMTVWDCFQNDGNELEKRFLRKRVPRRAFPDIKDWFNIVCHFTSRQITMEKDRLPALAGFAKRLQAQTGYTYLAGLWLEELPNNLLWANCQPDPMTKPLKYRAPTWSWAALEGEVFFPALGHKGLSHTCEIVGAHCQYDPPETLATVTDGWIDIEGPTNVVTAWTIHAEESLGSQIRLFTEGQLEDIQNPQYWIATMDQAESPKTEIARSEVLLLNLQSLPQFGNEHVIRSHALVLQIASRPGMGNGCFQRLGIAYLEFSSSSGSVTEFWPRKTIRII